MAERSKALRSGRSPVLWAWVRIPLLTKSIIYFSFYNDADARMTALKLNQLEIVTDAV